MNALIEQWQARARAALEQLQPRERLIVLAGSGVLAVMVLYLGIWEPLVNAQRQRAAALDGARALAVRIESAAALAQSGRRGGAVDRSAALLSVVDQTSRGGTLGKAPTRVQPDGAGDKAVKVWFDDVPFDNTLRWLGELQARYGVGVDSAEIEPGSAPGLVNARFTLGR